MILPGGRLRISGAQHAHLIEHLFPGDGLEAAAIALCSRFGADGRIHAVREIILVPHALCARKRDHLVWPGALIEKALDAAETYGESLFLIHSHPGGLLEFSALDDASDQQVMPGLIEAIETTHGSAIMTADGTMRARVYSRKGVEDVELVSIAGDDIRLCWADDRRPARPLAFTSEMTADLARLHAFVVGVSGTGSVTAEQAYRMGFGTVGLADPDHVERKNLNRILNATVDDATAKVPKVQMFAAASSKFAPDTRTHAFARSVLDRDVVLATAEADVLFSCVDSHEGRQICDLTAATFCIPLIDMGVQIPVRGASDRQAIAGVYGRIDYVQPGGASLEDRGVYSPQSVAEEHVARVAPRQHAAEVRDGYMKGRAEEAPSVIALNMRAAAAAVMEFVARAFPFRHDSNRGFARTIFDLAAGEEEHFSEDDFERRENPFLSVGLREPLLNIPALNRRLDAVA
ncbi:ThiF family adenylyltransferase [Phenylobacterium sp.]|uniref:ThiF family adenylyltransferase n=1 Tax=Phenylobacterium sp. TaxID=1871053 RepID=UPI00272FE317|nr:ThiF family adenylyltransferase [Phenylobacterium sp.]MDP2214926.1 ThiF family adenylyltransferase [Phenylobacterium sp.]